MNASRAATVAAASEPDQHAGAPGAKRIAVIGAGISGLACARTLMQAGHDVHVFERADMAGGRTRSIDSPFGSFDIGAQYFTVRDPRFELALSTVPGLCRPWSVTSVRRLDRHGKPVNTAPPPKEAHWVGTPHMQVLALAWATPLADAGRLHLNQRVSRLERSPSGESWNLQLEGPELAAGQGSNFDAVVLALPAPLARQLLQNAPRALHLVQAISDVEMAPCWTLTLAFPLAAGIASLRPQWNAARSAHERAAWVARESSKPGRTRMERWTLQASPDWSQEHRGDDTERVLAKLQKAFTEVTGIRATPRHAGVFLWPQAQTLSPLGQSHIWNPSSGLGLCGDWCLGRRLEDAFVSGLEMGLSLA